MKKIVIALILIVAVIATAAYVGGKSTEKTSEYDYLRIHVRANSNEQCDQDVKYKVKDEVVKFITPYCTECTDKQAAIEVITSLLPELEKVCDQTLKKYGYTYTSKASVRAEDFPTRVYGDVTLDAGVYDALIIELGTGKGDNWWCVIYPPLCFTAASEDVEYRSVIYDIIRKFFNN